MRLHKLFESGQTEAPTILVHLAECIRAKDFTKHEAIFSTCHSPTFVRAGSTPILMGTNYGGNPFSFPCHSLTFMRAGSALIFMGINYGGNPFSFACHSLTFVRAGSAPILMGTNYGGIPFSFACHSRGGGNPFFYSNSSYKSAHSGFSLSIKLIYHCSFHFCICFLR